MIDHALALLEMTDLPSWEDDAALRRELERLRDDVRAYQVAAGHDERKARIKAAQVSERADRINRFLSGQRRGIHALGLASRGHRHEV